jgi:Tfp pilus assembly protein PilE
MQEKGRGNLLLEILIVILIIVLVGTILYPSSTWKKESEKENICHSRMEAVQHSEYQYFSKTLAYTDSVDAVLSTVKEDPNMLAALDSLVNWDGLVSQDVLKKMVLSMKQPETMRSAILQKLQGGQPLGNLGSWDGLKYRLIDMLEKGLSAPDPDAAARLDGAIDWAVLLGENAFRGIIETAEAPEGVRRNTLVEINKGKPVQQTAGWRTFSPAFYEALKRQISESKRTDIWEVADKERWEELKAVEYKKNMDSLPLAEKDTLWESTRHGLWEKEKPVLWKKARKELWWKEGSQWMTENETVWMRIIRQECISQRRIAWESGHLDILKKDAGKKKEELWKEYSNPQSLTREQWETTVYRAWEDSLIAVFQAEKDSLWRTQEESLWEKENTDWRKDNKKYIQETIQGIWERERRNEWEPAAESEWTAQRTKDMEAFWGIIKEDTWNREKGEQWRLEEEKMAAKLQSLSRIDQAVNWNSLLGVDQIQGIVNALSLPAVDELWNSVKRNKKGSALFNLGLSGVFQKILIDSVGSCPLAHARYMIQVDDTSTIKKFSITCPIQKTDASGYAALFIDPATGDTTAVPLKVSMKEKLFGGASIRSHGSIDMDGKKSWEKKGR